MLRLSFTKRQMVALAACAAFGLAADRAQAQAQMPAGPDASIIATEAIAAPVILLATVKKESRVSVERAPGLPTGGRRTLVTADVERVLKAPGPVPPRIHYLVDWVPADGGDGPPRLKKQSFLLFLKPSAQRDDHYSLVSRRGQQPASAEAADLALGFATADVSAPVSGFRPDAVTAVFAWGDSRQFLVRGQGQRQITLEFAPADSSLMATFDDIGLVREPIAAGSLMWFLLQCQLPAALGDSVVRAYATDDLNPAAAYKALRDHLGLCRAAQPGS